jgi:hypothetical protein
MSSRADYTTEEWELLYLCPLYVGTAIATAAGSGLIGSVREAFAVATSPANAAREFRENLLVQELIATHNTPKTRDVDVQAFGRDMVQAQNRAFAACRTACAILAEKSTPGEAAGYKQWVLRVAETVAKAGAEGNFLGIGGQTISPPEEEILSILRRELGVSGGRCGPSR